MRSSRRTICKMEPGLRMYHNPTGGHQHHRLHQQSNSQPPESRDQNHRPLICQVQGLLRRRGRRERLHRPKMWCTPTARAREMGSLGPLQALACGGELMIPGMCSSLHMPLSTYAYVTGGSNLSERCPGGQTNNRAELIVRLILHKLRIFSDAWYSRARPSSAHWRLHP